MSYDTPDLVDVLKNIKISVGNNWDAGAIVVPAELQDLTIAGVGTTVTYYVEPLTGIGRTRVLVAWTAVPALDPTIIYADRFDHYIVRVLLGGATDAPWTTTPTNSITFENLPLNTAAVVEVKAVATSGRMSGSAGTFAFNTSKDTTPPSQTSTPVVLAALKAVTVSWNGLSSTGAAMPVDLSYVEVHMDTSNATFTPTSSTYVNRLDVGGGKVTISAVAYVPMFVRLVSVDSSGNKGTASAGASATPSKAVDTDAGFALPGDIAYRDEGNLIPDGSFESVPVVAYRDDFLKTVTNPSWDTTGGVAYAGTRCMKFAADAVSHKYWYLTGGAGVSSAVVVGGTQLYFAMRAKGIGANGSVFIEASFIDATGATFTWITTVTQTVSTGAWVLSEGVMTVPANAVAADFNIGTTGVTTGMWWVDTVQVRNVVGTMLIQDAAITNAKIANLAVNNAKIADLDGGKINAQTITTEKLGLGVLSTNLVMDSSFEDNYALNARGDFGWWYSVNLGGAASKRMPYARSGQYAAQAYIAAGSGSWVNLDSNVFALTPGSLYKAVAYAARYSGSSSISLRLFHGTTIGTMTSTEVTQLTLTGDTLLLPDSYVKLSGEYTIPAGHVVGRVEVAIWSSDILSSACQIDDVSCMQQGQGGAAELTAAGLRLFDTTGEEVSAFVSNRPNYISVMRSDTVLASINGAGAIFGQNLNIANDPIFQGQPLTTILDNRGKGSIFLASGAAFGATTCNAELGFGEIGFIPLANRQYKIIWHPPMTYVNTSVVTAQLNIRATSNGSIPTIGSAIMRSLQYHVPIVGFFVSPPDAVMYLSVTVTPVVPWRFLGTIQRIAGTGALTARVDSADQVPTWEIVDMGPTSRFAGQVVAANSGGGTGSPLVQTYEKTYGVASWASYNGSGAVRSGATSAYQGYYSGTNGNQYSRMTFDSAIVADLTGATINGAWLYFECQHTYAGSGAPSVVVRGDGTSVGSANVVAGGAYEYGIPTAAHPSPSQYMYGFGQAPSSSQTYYAYYNPTTMRLRVNYTK